MITLTNFGSNLSNLWNRLYDKEKSLHNHVAQYIKLGLSSWFSHMN